MRKQSILTYMGIGLGALLVACGGSSKEPTASSTSNLKGGQHHACMPLDGGTSPCARGDGGDDENEVDDEDGGTDDQKGDAGREVEHEDGGPEDMEGDGGRGREHDDGGDDLEGDGGRS